MTIFCRESNVDFHESIVVQGAQPNQLVCPGSNISHIKCDIPVVCHGEGCHRERVSTW